jgi:hypothetical protein
MNRNPHQPAVQNVVHFRPDGPFEQGIAKGVPVQNDEQWDCQFQRSRDKEIEDQCSLDTDLPDPTSDQSSSMVSTSKQALNMDPVEDEDEVIVGKIIYYKTTFS